MAWTDQCRLQACSQVEHKKESGLSARQAIQMLSKESGIPAKTLESWYYPSSVPENPGKTQKAPLTQEKLWTSVARRLDKLVTDIVKNGRYPAEITGKVRKSVNDAFKKMCLLIENLNKE